MVRVGTGLVLNKILAIYVGPAGYALIGQFQSLVAMVMGIASGAIGTGVTKYTAEYNDKPKLQYEVWRAATIISLIASIVGAAMLLLMREHLAAWLLADRGYASVFIWLGFSLVLMVANGLMLAIMNGKKVITSFVVANISGSVIGAAISLILTMRYGLYGALIALGLGQAVTCFTTAWLFNKGCAIHWRDLFGGFQRSTAYRLLGFAMMAIISALVVPASQMIIRDELSTILGLHTTGLWQAMWRISDLHLMLITSTMTVYFLPRFAELPAGPRLRGEVLNAYRFVIPLVILSSITLYFFRGLLVRSLLTADFLPISDALGWQLLGDTIKICSWVSAYTMISHARLRIYITTELIFATLLTLAIIIGAKFYGLRGTAIGYSATYVLYCATTVAILIKTTSAKNISTS